MGIGIPFPIIHHKRFCFGELRVYLKVLLEGNQEEDSALVVPLIVSKITRIRCFTSIWSSKCVKIAAWYFVGTDAVQYA